MKLPQLSLRELFLLVALAAMGCGWWVDRFQIAMRRQQLDECELEINQKWHMYWRIINGERKHLGIEPLGQD